MRALIGLFALGIIGAGCGSPDNANLINTDPGAPNGPPGTDGTDDTTDGGTPGKPKPLPAGDSGTTPPTPDVASPLVQGLSITEIAVFQAVKVDVMKAGANVATRAAPV